jgi:cell shape-determining protein MreC
MKTALKVFGLFLAFSLVASGLAFVGKVVLFPAHAVNKVADAGIRTFDGVVDKTLNADNAIYNYEWFKRQYSDYIALKNKVDLSAKQLKDYQSKLPADRTKWAREDKDEDSRLSTILLGQKQQLMDLISEYNAKSQMANRTIFKTGDLPQQLPNYVE